MTYKNKNSYYKSSFFSRKYERIVYEPSSVNGPTNLCEGFFSFTDNLGTDVLKPFIRNVVSIAPPIYFRI